MMGGAVVSQLFIQPVTSHWATCKWHVWKNADAQSLNANRIPYIFHILKLKKLKSNVAVLMLHFLCWSHLSSCCVVPDADFGPFQSCVRLSIYMLQTHFWLAWFLQSSPRPLLSCLSSQGLVLLCPRILFLPLSLFYFQGPSWSKWTCSKLSRHYFVTFHFQWRDTKH